MKWKKIITVIIFAAMLGIFTTCSPAAYASDETLAVTAAWADGDLLKIQVTDKDGVNSTLALRLSDYMDDTSSEYISVQAADLEGNKSGVIQVKNPYYVPADDKTEEIPDIILEILPAETPETAESNGKPLTPDGSGTVLDNVFDDNGKEIFSIATEEGDIFYLIVDRERTSDNVYLLNAVTEEDLMALAEKNGRIITPPPTTEAVIATVPAEQNITATVTPEPEIKGKMDGSNNNTLIFIIVAVLGVGGVGYYFKIHKKKKKVVEPETDDDEIDDSDIADDDELEEGDADGDE